MVPGIDTEGARILVYRRAAECAHGFCGTLRAAGYRVDCVDRSEVVRQELAAARPDVLVVDVTGGVAPAVSDLCRDARTTSGPHYLPILLLDESETPEKHSPESEAISDDVMFGVPQPTDVLLRVRSLVRLSRLAAEIHDSHQTIRSQRDELVRAHSQRGQLAALIVHDLKNPIAGIALNAKFLSRTSGMSDDAKEAVDSIASATQSMNRMVLNLLDIAKSEDGRLEARRDRIDVAALARTACEAMRMRAASSKQTLVVEPVGGSVFARVDPDLVRRVIENLVDNALRFTASGGSVTVSVSAPAADAGGPVEIRVADQGPGIPPEFRERVFDKYVQLDGPSELRSRTGRGMGLLFCRMAAEVHGGAICVESSNENGSVFLVSLPTA